MVVKIDFCLIVGRGESVETMSLLFLVSVADIVFVDGKPLSALCPCPLCVSSNSGKCLVTVSAVRPGHDANCLFLIAFSHVGFVRKPVAAWW
jgi:hypothetical protein